MVSARCCRLLPEIRIMPIPPLPGGVAIAAMISELTMNNLHGDYLKLPVIHEDK